MITYLFEVDPNVSYQFQVDRKRRYTPELDQADQPFWTALDYHQCSNCPLSRVTQRHCPTAVDLHEVIARFSPAVSYHKVTVRVLTAEREYRSHCDFQTGLYSLLGLVMATSACPILANFRPLANFHLPFATPEETLFRTVGAYLVKQYLVLQDGGQPDFELKNLVTLYEDMVVVNSCFVERIRAVCKQDANINALIRHDSFSLLVLFSLRNYLGNEKIKFFSAYQ